MYLPIVVFISIILADATPDTPPPSAQMPQVLFSAPINATWAANNPNHWLTLGIDGFLFQGVLDHLAINDEHANVDDTALVRELRIAHARLSDEGINANFLYTQLSPDDVYFLRRSRADALVENIGRIAKIAQGAALSGIVLDTQTSAFVHDMRWDGYPQDNVAATQAILGARRLGERISRTFYRNYPGGKLLYLAQEPLNAGPLWFHFFAGLLIGSGSTGDINIELLLQCDRTLQPDDDITEYLDAVNTLLELRLENDAADVWRKKGGIAPGLEPIGRMGERPITYYAPEKFRSRLIQAKLSASTYVWIDAANGGWWNFDDAQEETYTASTLIQGSKSISVELPGLQQYSAKTPIDGLLRVGPAVHHDDLEAFVLYEPEGAAVVAWESLFGRWAIPRIESPLLVRYLISDKDVLMYPESGHVVIPLDAGPVLVRRLPMGDWVTPVALDMKIDGTLNAGMRRSTVQLYFNNWSEMPLEASLIAWTESNYSLGDALFQLKLRPHAQFLTNRNIQGIFRAGESVIGNVSLTHAGGGSIHRKFTFPVQSTQKWNFIADGPILGAPIVLRSSYRGDNSIDHFVIIGGSRGDLHAINANGELRWQRRLQSGMTTAPLAWENSSGAVHITATDGRDQIYTFDEFGNAVWAKPLRMDETLVKLIAYPSTPLSSAASHESRHGPVILGKGSSILQLDSEGQPLWHIAGQPVFVDAGTVSHYDNVNYIWRTYQEPAKVSGGLEVWDEHGELVWSYEFEGIPTSPVLIQYRPDEVMLWLGTSVGEILGFNLEDGTLVEQAFAPFGRRVKELAHVVVTDSVMPWLLVLEEEGVHVLDSNLDVQWFVPLREGNTIIGDLPDRSLLAIIATNAGEFIGLTSSGGIAWRDKHKIISPLQSPLMMDIDGNGRVELLFGAGDGVFRVHDWQPLLYPRRPLDSLGNWGDPEPVHTDD